MKITMELEYDPRWTRKEWIEESVILQDGLDEEFPIVNPYANNTVKATHEEV